jgi:hypothetical protein
MAGSKGGKGDGPTITGAVRFGGKAYVAGQEQELQKAMEAEGVEALRGFGVDSTDVSTAGRSARSGARRQEIEQRQLQARAELAGRGRSAAPGQASKEAASAGAEELVGTTLSDLPGALAGITDKKTIQSARRRDKRAGAKPLYTARIEELEAEGDEGDEGDDAGVAGGPTDAPDNGQTGAAG